MIKSRTGSTLRWHTARITPFLRKGSLIASEQQLMQIRTTLRRYLNKCGGTCKYYFTRDVRNTSPASQLVKSIPKWSTAASQNFIPKYSSASRQTMHLAKLPKKTCQHYV